MKVGQPIWGTPPGHEERFDQWMLDKFGITGRESNSMVHTYHGNGAFGKGRNTLNDTPSISYQGFLDVKRNVGAMHGFDPLYLPSYLYDFQTYTVDWAVRKGRCAIFADCGLGKTPMQLVWAENVVRQTNKPVLVLTPLAVSYQTVREAEKFGIECERSNNGKYKSKIVVTNYERLHYFNSDDFAGVVCDESSIMKNFDGSRQKEITDFMRKTPYRLLCTATAAPNDYIELGTSSEALGELGRMDMLGQFFKNDENSLHPIWWGSRWRFKPHAERHFWRWICSWARAFRKPSDMGFADKGFVLPPRTTEMHVIKNASPLNGYLFVMPAVTLEEQRKERRLTIVQRCETVASKVEHDRHAVAWCHLNQEGDLLERLIPDAVQVSGRDNDESKEEKLKAFSDGEIRVLVTKPVMGAFGLNWQHCNHMTFFPSHSFEQYYQAVRRMWRFGQTNPVHVDIVTTEGESGVMQNLQRKADSAAEMFTKLVEEMLNGMVFSNNDNHLIKTELPTWL